MGLYSRQRGGTTSLREACGALGPPGTHELSLKTGTGTVASKRPPRVPLSISSLCSDFRAPLSLDGPVTAVSSRDSPAAAGQGLQMEGLGRICSLGFAADTEDPSGCCRRPLISRKRRSCKGSQHLN